jgi:hypothetical protein
VIEPPAQFAVTQPEFRASHPYLAEASAKHAEIQVTELVPSGIEGHFAPL